ELQCGTLHHTLRLRLLAAHFEMEEQNRNGCWGDSRNAAGLRNRLRENTVQLFDDFTRDARHRRIAELRREPRAVDVAQFCNPPRRLVQVPLVLEPHCTRIVEL